VRGIAELIGAKILWDADKPKTTLSLGEDVIELSLGDSQMIVNNKTITLDTPTILENGALYASMKGLSSSLSFLANWHSDEHYIKIIPYKPKEPNAYTIKEITSSLSQVGGEPINAIDNNYGTRWSASGEGSWMNCDLGEIVPISSIQFQWYRGNARVQTYDLLISEDGTDYTPIIEKGKTSGNTSEFESVLFPTGTKARFIKIVGYGTTESKWNSINELRIFK
jgi:hypothetical protein